VGNLTVLGGLNNTGTLEVAKGTLIAKGEVTGSGTASIKGGTLDLTSSFNENVTFTTSGELELAQSQGYAGKISGFSKSGGTSLDLLDIGFVSATEATFSGTGTGGVLTVTDGMHTATISLTGNYTASTFVASSDNNGGTIVVDPPAGAPSPVAFAAAMAGFGELGGQAIRATAPIVDRMTMLLGPHTSAA